MPGTVAGLTDEERSWMVGAYNVIAAAGHRDMGLGFAGWEKPGVLVTAEASLSGGIEKLSTNWRRDRR